MIIERQHPSGVTTFYDEDTEVFAEIQGYRPDTPYYIVGGWFDSDGLAALLEILEKVHAKSNIVADRQAETPDDGIPF